MVKLPKWAVFGGNTRSQAYMTPTTQQRLLPIAPNAPVTPVVKAPRRTPSTQRRLFQSASSTASTPGWSPAPLSVERAQQLALSPGDIEAARRAAESTRQAIQLASPGAGVGRARQGMASPAKIILKSKKMEMARAERLQREAEQAEKRAKAAARKAAVKADMQERLKSLESVRSEAAATASPYKRAKALADKEYAALKQSEALTSKIQKGRAETQQALSESAAEIELETRRMFQRLPRFQAAEKAIEKGFYIEKGSRKLPSVGRVVEEIPRKSAVGRQFQRARQSRRSEFARTQAAGQSESAGGMGGDQMLLWFGLPAFQQTAQQVLGGRFEQPSFTTEQYYQQIAAQQGIFPQA